MGFVDEVYQRQSKAFKLNLNFGYVLRHRDNGSARYFKPFEHEGLLDIPIYIHVSSRRDLTRLADWLRNLNLLESLMMQRPDTKWVIELLTNVRISVYKTNFLLGDPRNAVPEHIKLHKAIYSLVADKRTGKLFNDNFCAFRCLALHKGYSQKT